MSKFSVDQQVQIKQEIWNNPNKQRQVGKVVNTWSFYDVLNGHRASTERQFECAIRDSDKCGFGYDVEWPNGNINSWSHYELEQA